jgi:hypothetical protein
MLVFIVPLQSPDSTQNWNLVSRLAERTIASLFRQDCEDFRVILVCNEAPARLQSHRALRVIMRNFPTPSPSDPENRMTDKWKKVRVGLVAARQFTPCHIMIVDADDLVSNRLASHCAANSSGSGWVFDDGWIHDEHSKLIFYQRHKFDTSCGTSSILRVESSDLPATDEGPRGDNLILHSGHMKIRAAMAARGTPLRPLPFRGAVYIRGTGETHTRFALRTWRSKKVLLRKLVGYRPLTDRVRREFGLFEIDQT